MMLAFDVTDRVALISWQDSQGRRGTETIVDRKATEVLVPTIDRLIKDLAEPLQAVGVIKGPGSFTGIRVGLATAQGLRAACAIPVYGFSKQELVAAWAGAGTYTFVLPSGRDQVIRCQLVDGEVTTELSLAAMGDWISQTDCLSLVPLAWKTRLVSTPLTELALDHMAAGRLDETGYDLEPLYVRPADAKTGRTLIEQLLDIQYRPHGKASCSRAGSAPP